MAATAWHLWKHIFGTLAVVALLGLLGAAALDRAPVQARGNAGCGTIDTPNTELLDQADPSGNPIRCEQARLDREAEVKVVLVGSATVLGVSALGWAVATARLRRQR